MNPGQPGDTFRATRSAVGGSARPSRWRLSRGIDTLLDGMQIPSSRNEGTMAGTAERSGQGADVTYVVNRRGKHVHHGRTVAAWTGSTIALVAFILGAIAVVFKMWPLFWVSVGLAAVALIVTVVLQRMGYGAN